jgi:hypothetical protein
VGLTGQSKWDLSVNLIWDFAVTCGGIMHEIYGVTISALCVRLQRLNIIYIKDKKIYKSKGEAIGQAALF